MLDDLAGMRYVVAELAEWIGSTSAELAQGAQAGAQLAQGAGKVPQELARSLAGAQAGPERLAVTQNVPSQGQVDPSLPSYQASQPASQLASYLNS